MSSVVCPSVHLSYLSKKKTRRAKIYRTLLKLSSVVCPSVHPCKWISYLSKKKNSAHQNLIRYARTSHNFYFRKKRRGTTCSYVIDVLQNIVWYARTSHNLSKKKARHNLFVCRNQYHWQTERQTDRQTD